MGQNGSQLGANQIVPLLSIYPRNTVEWVERLLLKWSTRTRFQGVIPCSSCEARRSLFGSVRTNGATNAPEQE